MTIIRQQSLFGIQELYEMETTHRYESIISAIDLDSIYHEINKKSRLGAPVDLNYAAMIISMFVRIVERIPTIKDLIKRLKDDFVFKLNCGFLVSDQTPSESAYSRIITKLMKPSQQWKYTRLLREKQARQDPAGEERAEEAWRLPVESEYITTAAPQTLAKQNRTFFKNGNLKFCRSLFF